MELTGEQFYQLVAPSRRADFDPGSSALLEEISDHRLQFLAAMDDDFNTGGAIGELFEVVHALNRFANQLRSDSTSVMVEPISEYRTGMVVLKELCQILGLFRNPPAVAKPSDDTLYAPLIELLIELRARLRKEKNFSLSDEIRQQLTNLGITLEDHSNGTRWRVESPR